MRLHVERLGDAGPDWVLLHGWGLHGGLLRPLGERIAAHARVHLVDLPGCGASPLPEGDYSVATLVDILTDALPAGATWLGWSLGGHLALAAALRGAVARLVMVAASPCFTQRPDWPCATDPEVLATFAASLEQDWQGTLARFLALQALGSERARDEVRTLRGQLFAHGEPQLAALRGGLAILAHSDLRPRLAACPCPVTLIGGRNDSLVPVAALEATAQQLPQAELELLKGAGHAPFLSHPEAFLDALVALLPGAQV